jgi:hypothetical protein
MFDRLVMRAGDVRQLSAETELWSGVMKSAGIKPD